MTEHDDRAPDWDKVRRMVGYPDYGVLLCLSPWPDGGWLAGAVVIDRDWVWQQLGQGSIDPAMLNVPGDDDGGIPDWNPIDGFPDGVTEHGTGAADAIERLWAKIHALPPLTG